MKQPEQKTELPFGIIAAVLWASAIGMFVAGMLNAELSILRWAALGDAVLAAIATAIAAHKSFRG